MVIASTWSCVTKIVVTPSSRWSRAISARICTRSFASRFESGSSIRNDLRLADDRATHRDTLALAARKLRGRRFRCSVMPSSSAVRSTRSAHLLPRQAPAPQREGDVLEDGHVRVERVVLEDHRDVAPLRREVVDDRVADANLAFGDLLEARDHPQGSRLPAPRGADEDDELAVLDLEIELIDGTGAVGVDLARAVKDDPRHVSRGSRR